MPPTPASAVYTALLGGYERLNDDQELGDGSVPFICFTDDPSLTSSVWDVRLVTPLFARDLQRSQRDLKIRGHRDLELFERTLYIDNSVSLLAPPTQILDDWLADADVAAPAHSFRENVFDEFLAVLDAALDDPMRVNEQLHLYSDIAPYVLAERPSWNGMIARRHSPHVAAMMSRWFDEVSRYSRRDQLSSNFAFGLHPVSVRHVEIANLGSTIHRWPVEVGRLPQPAPGRARPTLPDLARERLLEAELNERQRRFDNERQLDNARHAAMLASTSWRVTAPLRALGSYLARIKRRNSPQSGVSTDQTGAE